MSLHTNTSIAIDGLNITSFENLKITQDIENHHSFEIIISQERLKEYGKTLFEQVKDIIGKEVIIKIVSELPQSPDVALGFKGIVTNVVTGKSYNGVHGFCFIKGFSPTALLDDDQNLQVYEEKTLQTIVSEVLKKYPKNILNCSPNPKNTETLKYSVQYKENSWQYLRRLASVNGEWFFYSGSKLIFGKHSPTEFNLSHLKDLLMFNLDITIRPANINFHTYEYRSDKAVTVDTKSQDNGRLNELSNHMLKISDSLFTNQALYKVNHIVTDKAQEEIKSFASMQRKSSISQMVFAKGQSVNLGLIVGSVANIKEEFASKADHGKYFITNVTHICDGDGNYHNSFTSIPSDAAAPAFHRELIPKCEAQSAEVIENHDPKGLGRVRVRFHWQTQGMSPWIRILSASGGGEKGMYFIPEKGEEVWVDFEGGNPELPYVAGTKYNGNAKSSFGNAENDIKAIKTRSGHIIELNDAKGKEKITIKDKDGNILEFDTAKKSITITSPETLTINAKNIKLNAEENITIGAKKQIDIGAEKDINVISKSNLALQAQKSLTAKSKTGGVTVEAMKDAIVKGQNVMAQGKVKATVSGVQTKISGKMTAIQGSSGKIDVV